MCPVSCIRSPASDSVSAHGEMSVIMGYSMPPLSRTPSIDVICRPRIRPEIRRQLLDRVAREARAADGPCRGGLGETVEAVDVDGVRRLPERRRVRDERPRRVPHILVARPPCEIAHVGRGEMPGSGRASPANADADGAPGSTMWTTRPLRRASASASLRGGRQHVARVLERPGCADRPAVRNREADIVVRGVHIELSLQQVRVRHPAIDVIVHCDLRVPVAHEVDDGAPRVPRRPSDGEGGGTYDHAKSRRRTVVRRGAATRAGST